MPFLVWPLLAALSLASAQPALPDPDPPGPELTGPELTGPELTGPELTGPELTGPESMIIDRAVAVVGVRVITRSELEMARWLEERDPSPVREIGFDEERPAEWWIDQVVIRELAGDISVYQPDPAAVRERAERLLQAIDPEELATRDLALGADRGSIVAWVHGRMVVERFVIRNLGAAVDPGLLPEGEASPSYAEWLDELRDLVAVRRIPVESPTEAR